MKYIRNCFPTPVQEHLLKASLFNSKDAIKEWELWQANTELNQMDAGSIRLLPLLYFNLKQQGINDVKVDKLKPYYVTTWTQNRFRFNALIDIIERLKKRGISPLVLKGAPLIEYAYQGDLGLRPMDDIDVMVETSKLHVAEEELQNNGWIPSEGLPTHIQGTKHSAAFLKDKAVCLDLHWRPFMEFPLTQNPQGTLWPDAQKINIDGLSILAPSKEITLLSLLIHGARWNPTPSIRWCADAYLLINYNIDAIRWDKILAMAKEHHFALSIFNALNFLKNTLGCPIPQSIIEELRTHKKTIFERSEYFSKTLKFGGFFALGFQYLRLNRSKPWFLHPLFFSRFLLHTWNIQTISHLPIEVLKRVKGRLER
jgi:hypothetical protein